MDEFTDKVQGGLYAADADFRKLHSVEGFSTKENDMQELEIAQQALTEIDFRLAYSSEKLVNLHVLYIYLLARENDLEAMDSKNNCILANVFERAMTFDLLSGILDSEVRELDNFMDTLQEEIVDARHKIFSCRHLTEVFHMMEEKLHDSEESMKQFQQQLVELKMQSSQLQKTVVAFQHENCKFNFQLTIFFVPKVYTEGTVLFQVLDDCLPFWVIHVNRGNGEGFEFTRKWSTDRYESKIQR